MSGGEIAALIVSVPVALAAIGMLFALRALVVTLRQVRLSVEELRGQTVPLVSQLRGTVTKAEAELERVDHLLGTAESIGTTVDSASRLAYLFFANPVVKIMAAGAGTGRAYRRLRRGRDRDRRDRQDRQDRDRDRDR